MVNDLCSINCVDYTMNNRLKIIVLFTTVMLAACSPNGHERNDYTVLPDGLKDCKFYRVSNGIGAITVVRCPNSSTTVHSGGKQSQTTVTVE